MTAMDFKPRTLRQLADLICGNGDQITYPFTYRSSSFLTEFFGDCDTDYAHDGSTRWAWVADTLKAILAEPHSNTQTPPASFARVIRRLMDQGDAQNDDAQRSKALAMLNAALTREGFEAFYADDKQCYLRHLATNTIAVDQPNPHRPFSAAERKNLAPSSWSGAVPRPANRTTANCSSASVWPELAALRNQRAASQASFAVPVPVE